VCVWLLKLENPWPLLIGGGIGVLAVLSEMARWAFGRARPAGS